MTPRDEHGRYTRQAPRDTFGEPDRNRGTVSVDVGRGNFVEVEVGAPFVNTVEQLARDANYGGYYRVFLAQGDGESQEIVNPGDSPETIESGMRIAITSYDKVG
jgi:hypothetical protein